MMKSFRAVQKPCFSFYCLFWGSTLVLLQNLVAMVIEAYIPGGSQMIGRNILLILSRGLYSLRWNAQTRINIVVCRTCWESFDPN